ncbi:MAG: hypothetical protein KC546_10650 [Anaerolineae bacterium]|nr:hypothetical protein [Anaerolineae bacterium]
MKYLVVPETSIPQGRLVYRKREYSLDFLLDESRLYGGYTLCIDTLQIEVDPVDQLLLYPWGYFPHTSWQQGRLPKFDAPLGMIRVVTEKEWKPGIAISIGDRSDWQAKFDESLGLIRLAKDTLYKRHDHIQIAPNVVASLFQNDLVALWLRPEFV